MGEHPPQRTHADACSFRELWPKCQPKVWLAMPPRFLKDIKDRVAEAEAAASSSSHPSSSSSSRPPGSEAGKRKGKHPWRPGLKQRLQIEGTDEGKDGNDQGAMLGLLRDQWSKGAMSTVAVQRFAEAAGQDGASGGLPKLRKIGYDGKFPNNTQRDLMRALVPSRLAWSVLRNRPNSWQEWPATDQSAPVSPSPPNVCPIVRGAQRNLFPNRPKG